MNYKRPRSPTPNGVSGTHIFKIRSRTLEHVIHFRRYDFLFFFFNFCSVVLGFGVDLNNLCLEKSSVHWDSRESILKYGGSLSH